MSTQTLEKPSLELTKAQEQINNGLIAFNDKKAELEALAESSKGLTIAGIDDKAGYKLVSETRKKLKNERVQITKDGKMLRDNLTKVNRLISEKEKELVGIISPIEEELQAEEDRIDAEKERLRLEAEERETARIQARIDTLAQYGFELDYSDIKSMSDAAFDTMANQARVEYERELAEKAEAERVRLEQEAKERAEREVEAERLRKEREELEAERLRQAEAQRKLDEEAERIAAEYRKLEEAQRAENERLRKEQEAFEREAELVKARAEAAEKARKEAEQAAIDAENKRKAEAEKARVAAERKAARQPDRKKIELYVSALKAVPVPEIKTEEGLKVMEAITSLMTKLETYALGQIETL